jgi:quinol-cytochrome oxidoreductase complex cytochrome b subunit
MKKFIRQSHRWISMAFVATVIANFVAMGLNGGQQPPPWITYSPLLPLALLMLSGIYLFILPYATRRRGETLETSAS